MLQNSIKSKMKLRRFYDNSPMLNEAQSNFYSIEVLKSKIEKLSERPIEAFDVVKEKLSVDDLAFSTIVSKLLFEQSDEDTNHYFTSYILKWLKIRIAFYEKTILKCDDSNKTHWQASLDKYKDFYNFLKI